MCSFQRVVTLNNCAGHPEVVQRIVREGHEIGNHMMRDEPSIRLAEDDFEYELLETQSIIERHSSAHLDKGLHWDNHDDLQQPVGPISDEEHDNASPLPKVGKKWFRPGSGFFSARMIRQVGICGAICCFRTAPERYPKRHSLSQCEKHGYDLVLGSVYPHDPQVYTLSQIHKPMPFN